jgi:hypothetical protein
MRMKFWNLVYGVLTRVSIALEERGYERAVNWLDGFLVDIYHDVLVADHYAKTKNL